MKYICTETQRLDTFLTTKIDLPRNQIAGLIKKVGIEVNQKLIKKTGFKVQNGDRIVVNLPKQESSKEQYIVNFDLEILYEDEYLLIINKPPQIIVHGAPSVKEATVVDWLKSKNISLSTLSGEERHGIVHRIDKQTSGALAIAKTNEAHIKLSQQLEQKTMGRYYLALINLPLKENCIVEKPIARNPKNRLKMGIVEGGREAKSAFCKLLESEKSSYELIGIKLYTGRTHQIRVHLESISRSILGDDLYGFKSQKATIPRVMLHAHMLYVQHPLTNKTLFVKAPLFDDFNGVLEKYFKRTIYEQIIASSNYLDCFSLDNQWLRKFT